MKLSAFQSDSTNVPQCQDLLNQLRRDLKVRSSAQRAGAVLRMFPFCSTEDPPDCNRIEANRLSHQPVPDGESDLYSPRDRRDRGDGHAHQALCRSRLGYAAGRLHDQNEAAKTRRILDVGIPRLLWALLATAFSRPRTFARALAESWRLGRQSDRGAVIHLAYLAEACVLRTWTQSDEIAHLHAHFGSNSAAVALLCRLLGGPRATASRCTVLRNSIVRHHSDCEPRSGTRRLLSAFQRMVAANFGVGPNFAIGPKSTLCTAASMGIFSDHPEAPRPGRRG